MVRRSAVELIGHASGAHRCIPCVRDPVTRMAPGFVGEVHDEGVLATIGAELTARLEDEECRVQDAAVAALGRPRESRNSVPFRKFKHRHANLILMLTPRLPRDQFTALLPALYHLLDHEDFHMREAAVATLGHQRGAGDPSHTLTSNCA